ncbi:MAG: hypothetical protein CSA65_00690 [Proteobacteria bacterium]|nr:MAG: hypothetical protein CSA65_00690 [Pseudomonadota bacterium]
MTLTPTSRPRALLVTTTMAALVGSIALPQGASALPFSKLKHGRKLSKAQRKIAAEAMATIKAYQGCDKVLSGCLKQRNKKTEIAWRLADYVAFLTSKGVNKAAIIKILERRRRSALGKQHTIDTVGWPRIGSVKAPITIVEFADFRCTHCTKVGPLLSKLAKRYKSKVTLVFKPYPLKPYGAPLRAAQAALAAQRQGKFWELSELLFSHRDKHDKAGLRELAKRARLDLIGFDAAMTDRALLKQIEKSKIEGLRLGIRGTPTIYINGRQFLLRKDEMHLTQRIEDELFILGK